jgi:hypothetical protein
MQCSRATLETGRGGAFRQAATDRFSCISGASLGVLAFFAEWIAEITLRCGFEVEMTD